MRGHDNVNGMGIGAASTFARGAARGAAVAMSGLADIILPPTCPGCGALAGGHGALCEECWPKVQFIEKPICPILGTPFSYDMGEGIVSAAAIADPPRFDRARSAVLFDDLARSLVHGLKYRDRTDLAKMMARWMLRAGDGYVEECHAIVPVPLHRWRLVRRRYNQAAELARALAHLSGRPMLAGALVRRRRTRQQVGLAARQRQENVRNAFLVPEREMAGVAGRRIVLVDDVYTTGATVEAATRTLRRAGAEEVTVLTFARVHRAHI